ncbi:MAG: COX15/CtaA family protein [Burkholderiales bacterium]
MYRRLILFATALTFGIVVLGAFVRLSDAGLGCPDWPGCYGQLLVPVEAHELAAAAVKFPSQPVEVKKGWIEMLHRYFASSLGLVILAVAFTAWLKRRELRQPLGLPIFLIVLVIFQGMLGMWTVTLKLYPAVVTAHLLGGMTTLSLLTWLLMRQTDRQARNHIGHISTSLTMLGAVALGVLALQILLGGWVSTNYAALACTDFPRCHGSWAPAADFANGFYPLRELGRAPNGDLLHLDALTGIHWMHRVGALITFCVVGLFAIVLLLHREMLRYGLFIVTALAVQLSLGIANVLLSLPLPLAVAHNAGAALLLVILVATNYRIHHKVNTRISDHVDFLRS